MNPVGICERITFQREVTFDEGIHEVGVRLVGIIAHRRARNAYAGAAFAAAFSRSPSFRIVRLNGISAAAKITAASTKGAPGK